jgi:TPR repeat protein
LEADPLKKTVPIKFEDLQYLELIDVCIESIEIKYHNIGRYYLLRARGYLRSRSYEEAISDIKHSHDLGYAAATFALATRHHFGGAIPKDLTKAEFLYKFAYSNGVKWAAQGISILYDDISFSRYNSKLSNEWFEKF